MSATLQEVQKLCTDLFKQKAVIDAIKDRLKDEQAKQGAIESKILAAFEDAECEKQSIPGAGTVYVKDQMSYKIPRTDEQKAALKEYMGSDTWNRMASINSATLNSWAKGEFEKAVEEGNHEFKIPGLDDPTFTKKIATRKVN